VEGKDRRKRRERLSPSLPLVADQDREENTRHQRSTFADGKDELRGMT
jgi:hypothetical protein